jgi:hypothetical protein
MTGKPEVVGSSVGLVPRKAHLKASKPFPRLSIRNGFTRPTGNLHGGQWKMTAIEIVCTLGSEQQEPSLLKRNPIVPY